MSTQEELKQLRAEVAGLREEVARLRASLPMPVHPPYIAGSGGTADIPPLPVWAWPTLRPHSPDGR